MIKKRNKFSFGKKLLITVLVLILLVCVGFYLKVFTGNAVLDSYLNTAYASPLDVFHENVSIFNISSDSLTAVDDIVNLSLNVSLRGYVYKKGYIYNFQSKSWEVFNFDQSPVGISYWIKDFASVDLLVNVSRALKNGENYIVAYACQKINKTWQCGCQTEDQKNCTRWMLHKFNVSNILITPEECVTDLDCFGGSCIEGSCLSAPPCLSSCACSANTAMGDVCDDECGGVCEGTKQDGTSNYPFAIYNWAGLNNIRNNLGASYILMNDLTPSDSDYVGIGDSWQPIGNSTPKYQFTGNFDGNGNTITNLTISKSGASFVGLFGYASGKVSDIGLTNVGVIGSNNVGSIVGYLFNTGKVLDSYSIGTITATGTNIGGLVGYSDGEVSNSYSMVAITGNNSVGGLVGEGSGKITNSYSTGNVNGVSLVGGLIGNLGTVVSSYWDMDTSGQTTSASGIGKNTTEMKLQSTFSNWNFTSTWDINSSINEGYPYLR